MRTRTTLVALALATLVIAPGAGAQEPAPAVEEPEAPVEAVPADPSPEPTPPDAEAEPEAGDVPITPPPVDPSAPLERFRRGTSRWTRSTDDDSDTAPSVADAPPAVDAPDPGPGARIQLRLRNGTSVEGSVVSETPEGWMLRLASGETRFYDRLDVASDNAPRAERPSPAQKLMLAASLLWPGAGQVLYGGLVQQGPPWQRSALVVGTVLVVVTLGGLALVAAGLVIGVAVPPALLGGNGVDVSNIILGGPITLAGAVAIVLAMSVGLLDAGARVILD